MRYTAPWATIFVLATVWGCAIDSEAENGGATSRFDVAPDRFVVHPANPVFESGDFFSGSNWNDPHVITIDGTYVLYMSSNIAPDDVVRIYRFTSSDAMQWTLDPTTPVLEPSAGQWDAKGVETPAVVYFRGAYHMFWTGYATTFSDSANFKIGHATSPDGIAWTKASSYIAAPTDPDGAINFDFNQFVVAEPGPVVFNDTLYLYFTALGANIGIGASLQVIGLMTSEDGQTWSAPQSVLEPDQTLYPRTSGVQYLGYSTPHGVVVNDEMHLFFDVVVNDPWQQVKLHHARSADGVSGWVHYSQELFDYRDFSWTFDGSGGEIRSPAALVDGDTLYLWFAGHVLAPAPTLGVGLATLTAE